MRRSAWGRGDWSNGIVGGLTPGRLRAWRELVVCPIAVSGKNWVDLVPNSRIVNESTEIRYLAVVIASDLLIGKDLGGDSDGSRPFLRCCLQPILGETPMRESSISDEANETLNPFEGNVRDFVPVFGTKLFDRVNPFFTWVNARSRANLWPYTRALNGPVGPRATLSGSSRLASLCLNFASQDYLGLGQDRRIYEAAHLAIEELGVHSAGSPTLAGRTRDLEILEDTVADILGKESVLIYPTGWAAGFGVIRALVRESDAIIIDKLAHNCLLEGASHATKRIYRFSHNSIEELQDAVAAARERDRQQGIFVIIESLYSMDSDVPDIVAALDVCREYEAILIVDVAHDFGSMGKHGLGLLEQIGDLSCSNLVVVGSFSKTFASNGGFVAGPAALKTYCQVHSPSLTFSNAISPVQTRIIQTCVRVVFSDDGDVLRRKLECNVRALRDAMQARGFVIAGDPSPIVPVLMHDEKIARATSREIVKAGLLANLVEFPAVAKGSARFRFQVMASHSEDDAREAGNILCSCQETAKGVINTGFVEAR